MARLVLILLVPLVCLAVIIYKLAKVWRVVSADDMLISAYAPSLAVRCHEDFDLLDARRTRIFPRLSARIMRTYPANVWYGLYANGTGDGACPPARPGDRYSGFYFGNALMGFGCAHRRGWSASCQSAL